MAELTLPDPSTLQSLQGYVQEMKAQRGFRNVKKQAVILLMKEVGELAQATRATWGDEEAIADQARAQVAEELADILIYLLDISNQYGIDLFQALAAREEVNKGREWQPFHRY